MPPPDNAYEEGRYFLKDTIRLHIDFSQTEQSRGLSAPPLQKSCSSEALSFDLPDGRESLEKLATIPVGKAMAERTSVRRYAQSSLSMEELSGLLWATQGVREVLNPTCALRTVPSAGARHAFESYLVVSRVESLKPGLYRYLPFDQRMVRLRLDDGIALEAARACHHQSFIASAAVVFFWTALPARMEWRYGRAAHKVIALDAGHVCQNLYLAGQAMEAGVCAIAAYDQEACDRLLGVDGQEEFTVYIAALGKNPTSTG